jgi:hypothetical protein
MRAESGHAEGDTLRLRTSVQTGGEGVVETEAEEKLLTDDDNGETKDKR